MKAAPSAAAAATAAIFADSGQGPFCGIIKMTMQTSKHFRKLVNNLGFGEIVPAGEQSYRIRHRNRDLSAINNPARNTLRLATRVGTLHDRLGHGLIPLLLEANDEPENFIAGALAVESDTNEVMLVREDSLAALDQDSVTEFCLMADKWSAVIEHYNEHASNNGKEAKK